MAQNYETRKLNRKSSFPEILSCTHINIPMKLSLTVLVLCPSMTRLSHKDFFGILISFRLNVELVMD